MIAEAVNGGKAEQIEIFKTRRYFALTGQHLPARPPRSRSGPGRSPRWPPRWGGKGRKAKGGKPASAKAKVDTGGMSAELAGLVDGDPKLNDFWANRTKLDKGRDTTASGLDYSLARYLGRRGVPAAVVEEAVRLNPHGQAVNGKVADVERRVAQLLRGGGGGPRRQGGLVLRAAWRPAEGLPRQRRRRSCARPTEFAGRVRFDELPGAASCRGLPWEPGERLAAVDRPDDLRARRVVPAEGCTVKPATCAAAVQLVAAEHPHHPVRELPRRPELGRHAPARRLARDLPRREAEHGRDSTCAGRAQVADPGRRPRLRAGVQGRPRA